MAVKIKRALTLMCIAYTVIISLMYCLAFVFSSSASILVPTPTKALSALVFSLVIGLASLLLSPSGTPPLKLFFHFAVCLAAFALLFGAGGGFSLTGGTSITATLCFVCIYAFAMAVRAIVLRLQRKKSAVDAESEYTSVFK